MEPIANENYSDEGVECDDVLFQSTEEMETSLSNLSNGDLSVIGKIWIQALKTVLVGANFGLIPVVQAWGAPEFLPPKKPPKMKYKDLPIYSSPHRDYKDYLESKEKCPDANVRLIQKALLPYVKSWRKKGTDAFCSASCSIKCTCQDICNSISDSKKQFKKDMRDPNNLQVRQGVVAGSTLLGFLIGGRGGIPRRIFFTSLGALATGSLCFPKETDEIFRDVAYQAAKMAVAFYNLACRKNSLMSERLPCNEEPPPPVCPAKK